MSTALEFVLVGLIGATVGFVEVLSRYTDSLRSVARLWATWLYAAVNAGAAALVLMLARSNDWTFGIPGDETAARVIGSGVAAMALLRSGIGLVKFGDKEVAAGPGALFTAMLGIFDRVANRTQGEQRSAKAAHCMAGISFEKAQVLLPEHCLLLLKDPTKQESTELANAVSTIAKSTGSDQAKAYNLGVALINFAGPEVTLQAVRTLRSEIEAGPGEEPAATAPPSPEPIVVDL